jgi:hypothetical protein
MDCLRGLVGLLKEPMQDFGAPIGVEDYQASALNLYAWNLLGPVLLDDGNMWPNAEGNADFFGGLVDAYEAALVQVAKELPGFLGDRIKPAFPAQSRVLGEYATTGIVAVTGGLAGYALPTRLLAGATLTIRKIGLILNTSRDNVAITVTRYAGPLPDASYGSNLNALLATSYFVNQQPEVLKVWNLPVTGLDTKLYSVTPLDLPLDGSVYVISYPVTTGFYPMNNQLSCNCGNKDESINKILTQRVRSLNGDQAHGLLLDISATCDFSGLICDLLLNNQYQAAVAHIIYYKTALNVLADLLGGKLSPAIQVNKEDLEARRTDWEGELSRYLSWLTANWDSSMIPSDRCYVCPEPGKIYRGTITL